MYSQNELESWLQQSIRLFPDVQQWMKIWQDAKDEQLSHLSAQDYQTLLRYLEDYYKEHRQPALAR